MTKKAKIKWLDAKNIYKFCHIPMKQIIKKAR